MISLLQRTILDYPHSVLPPVKRISLLACDLREKRGRSEVYIFESRLSRVSSLFRSQFTTDEIRTTNQSVSFRPTMWTDV